MSSSSTTTGTEHQKSTKMFHEKLSILNENFLRFVSSSVEKWPHSDLTPTLKDYQSHVHDLDAMYALHPSTDGQNLIITSATTITTSSQPMTSTLVSVPAPIFGSLPAFKPAAENPLVGFLGTPALTTTTATPNGSVQTPTFNTFASIVSKPTENLFVGLSSTAASTNASTTSSAPLFAFGKSTTLFATTTTTSIFTSIASKPTERLFGIPSSTSTNNVSSTSTSVVSAPVLSLATVLTNSKSRKRTADTSADDDIRAPKQKQAPAPTPIFGSLPAFKPATENPLVGFLGTPALTTTTTTATPNGSVQTPAFNTFASIVSKPTENLFAGLSSTAASTNASTTTSAPLFAFGKSTTLFATTTTISLTSGSTTPIFPSIVSKPTEKLFGGLSSTASTNNVFSTSATSLFTKLTSHPTTSATLTGTSIQTPSFVFGSSQACKPSEGLFGGIAANGGASKDDVVPDEDESDEKPEEFVPKDNIMPIFAQLPPKVETKSGEEDEEVLLETRCRLYRFDKVAKENRERGTGDIKILRNKRTGRHRCIVRSGEGLSKLFANFIIFPSFKVETRAEKPAFLIWSCKDFSEIKDGSDETFIAKFRDVAIAQNFAKKVEEIVVALPKTT